MREEKCENKQRQTHCNNNNVVWEGLIEVRANALDGRREKETMKNVQKKNITKYSPLNCYVLCALISISLSRGCMFRAYYMLLWLPEV